MLIVMGEVVVEAGAVDKVRDALHTKEQETRKEPGCLGYAFSLDINDASTVRISERWESLEALQAHFATPHMAAFGLAVAELEPKSMEIQCYEVAREVKLPG